MFYTNNQTSEQVIAYQIDDVIILDTHVVIKMQSVGKVIGLYPEQTANYTPIVGDIYIDNGGVELSNIIQKDDFAVNYTVV